MLSRCRSLLPLVVALSLSTLASANSAPVSAALLHSSGSVYDAQTYSGNLTNKAGDATPLTSGVFSNFKAGENGNAHLSAPLSGNAMLGRSVTNFSGSHFASPDGIHGTIARRNGNFAVWHEGSPTATTPEPGSLMLLSTGLIGIAGVVRRKLRG